jgi:hypothetical protein
MFNNGSTPNLTAPLPDRRAVSQQLPLPDKTANPNAPWMPPQPHQRAASAQVSGQHLAPINTAQDLHRKPIPSEPSHGHGSRRAVSANSSPVGLQPANGLPPNKKSSPPMHGAVPPPVQTLPVPRQLGEPTSAKGPKRKSWFGGGGAKLSKGGKEEQKSPASWILGHGDQRPPYDTAALLNAHKACIEP